MNDVLLDTCVVIDFLRGNRAAGDYVHSFDAKPSVSVVTIAELFQGFRSQRREVEARVFLRECRILIVSEVIAEQTGAILRHYKSSHDLDMPDALIAATAEHHGLDLATLNVKHFPMIKRLKAAY
jgi:predicted nucleic acid-binding protein